MTTDPRTVPPTRNPLGAAFDAVLLLFGTYLTASGGGRLVKRVAAGGQAAAVSGPEVAAAFALVVGATLIALSVTALTRNLRRVPRDSAGRPLPGREGGE